MNGEDNLLCKLTTYFASLYVVLQSNDNFAPQDISRHQDEVFDKKHYFATLVPWIKILNLDAIHTDIMTISSYIAKLKFQYGIKGDICKTTLTMQMCILRLPSQIMGFNSTHPKGKV
eukprot:11124476-Ditylum_brightwellii.AAC.1